MFDVFYTGPSPNLFAHERRAHSVAAAIVMSKTKYFWFINGNNDYSNFDFNWLPDKWEAHHQHVFSDQWSRNSETYFVNKNSSNDRILNYNTTQTLIRKEMHGFVSPLVWSYPPDILIDTIDFSWHPDPMDPPYRYQFPTKYQRASGVEYAVPEATNKKYTNAFEVQHDQSEIHWTIPDDVDRSSVDLTWRPDPNDPPYCYQFPTKFQEASGVKFSVRVESPNRYTSAFTVQHFADKTNWVIPDNIVNPNLTWRPNPLDPPFIYKFPSQYVRDSGLEYCVPGATEIKFVNDISVSFDAEAIPRYYIETTIEDLIANHTNEVFWALNKEMNYNEFDFSWNPDVTQQDFIHVFGSQWQKHAATYYVDATRDSMADGISKCQYNYVEDQTVKSNSSIDIFYIDKSNTGSNERYKELSARFDNISRVRFANNIFSTIKRISEKSSSSKIWVISSENDYTDFNFDWHAEPWQNYMLHVFGTKEQKWSDTYLINKHVFDDHARWCKDIKDIPDLHFVEDQKTKAINVNDIYEIDFGQHNKREIVQHNKLKTTRFVDSYLAVIKRIVASSASEYIWLISNICDYTNFNFDWRPEPYQATMLHVFGPGNNKFGDTFLVHVPTFKEQADKLELLDWYKTVNYCTEQIVPRLPYDQVPYIGDDLTNVIKDHRFNSPYALFFPEGQDVSTIDYNPSVWRLKDRAIHTFTESGSVVLAPRDTLQYLDTQCYDYPEIKREKAQFLAEKPLDIVFISNGESTADAMYEHLTDITKHDSTLVVKRVDGVNGRAAAYKAAAEISDTDWAFNVFAKLEIDPDFDFHWQPDRLQEPKHYIFHAFNSINGLEYGHQGCIAYNKKLVLETDKWGLDFTLSKEHEVIPILSGTARYDTDPWIVWRTSFREVIKLLASHPNRVTRDRLSAWYNGKEGKYGYMSVNGAADAARYFREVKGDMDKLLLTFEWDWLKEYYDKYYYDTP